MPPSALQGLNVIDSPPYTTATAPDITAQLDLWTNLAFSSDEPLRAMPNSLDDLMALGESSYTFEEEDDAPPPPSASGGGGHDNILDVLSTLGLDPFLVPPGADEEDEDEDDGSLPAPKRARTSSGKGEPPVLNAAEDKRRRNTAASARFRAKKKEREAALEKRSKELEGKVGELERECEALRRENGWLKGLVVGVTQGHAEGASAKRKRGD